MSTALAIDYLKQVQVAFPNSSLARQASMLEMSFLGAAGGPDRASSMKTQIDSFAQTAVAIVDKRGARKSSPTYKTSIFKCLGDYDSCCATHDWRTCAALAVVCFAQQLITFASKV